MSDKLNVVVRLNGKIFKSSRDINNISHIVNHIDFAERDQEHIKKLLVTNVFGGLAPRYAGLLVIDYDTNLLISYQKGFIAGTITRGQETPELPALYEAGKIMQDTIDYMIDNRPFRNDFYNSDYKSDGELVMKKLTEIGFIFTSTEIGDRQTPAGSRAPIAWQREGTLETADDKVIVQHVVGVLTAPHLGGETALEDCDPRLEIVGRGIGGSSGRDLEIDSSLAR